MSTVTPARAAGLPTTDVFFVNGQTAGADEFVAMCHHLGTEAEILRQLGRVEFQPKMDSGAYGRTQADIGIRAMAIAMGISSKNKGKALTQAEMRGALAGRIYASELSYHLSSTQDIPSLKSFIRTNVDRATRPDTARADAYFRNLAAWGKVDKMRAREARKAELESADGIRQQTLTTAGKLGQPSIFAQPKRKATSPTPVEQDSEKRVKFTRDSTFFEPQKAQSNSRGHTTDLREVETSENDRDQLDPRTEDSRIEGSSRRDAASLTAEAFQLEAGTGSASTALVDAKDLASPALPAAMMEAPNDGGREIAADTTVELPAQPTATPANSTELEQQLVRSPAILGKEPYDKSNGARKRLLAAAITIHLDGSDSWLRAMQPIIDKVAAEFVSHDLTAPPKLIAEVLCQLKLASESDLEDLARLNQVLAANQEADDMSLAFLFWRLFGGNDGATLASYLALAGTTRADEISKRLVEGSRPTLSADSDERSTARVSGGKDTAKPHGVHNSRDEGCKDGEIGGESNENDRGNDGGNDGGDDGGDDEDGSESESGSESDLDEDNKPSWFGNLFVRKGANPVRHRDHQS